MSKNISQDEINSLEPIAQLKLLADGLITSPDLTNPEGMLSQYSSIECHKQSWNNYTHQFTIFTMHDSFNFWVNYDTVKMCIHHSGVAQFDVVDEVSIDTIFKHVNQPYFKALLIVISDGYELSHDLYDYGLLIHKLFDKGIAVTAIADIQGMSVKFQNTLDERSFCVSVDKQGSFTLVMNSPTITITDSSIPPFVMTLQALDDILS